tara:strand:+ start:262 stop:525 length:264 start_codon:yes stop_codon:yes gene_type:complete
MTNTNLIERRLKLPFPDNLYIAKCNQRELNKEIKKCKQYIEEYSILIGSYGNDLKDLLNTLDKLNLRIRELEDLEIEECDAELGENW